MRNFLAVTLSLALLVAGCGGGAATTPLVTNIASPNPGNGKNVGPMSSVHIILTLPSAVATNASTRKPTFVSPSTQSLSVQVDTNAPVVQNVSASAPNCSNAGASAPINCTITVSATVGSHTVQFITYDKPNANGNTLSANATTVTFVAGQNPAIPIVLSGVPVGIQVVPLPGSTTSIVTNSLLNQPGMQFVFGTPQVVAITALDADGNYIVGPGAPTFSFTTADTNGSPGVTVTPVTGGNENQFSIQAPNAGYTTLTITATPQSGSNTSPVTLAYTLAAVAKVTTVFSNNSLWAYFIGLTYDPIDGNIYTYTENSNCLILRSNLSGTSGVTTAAGNATNCVYGASSYLDGTGTAAEFSEGGVQLTFDSADANMYVSDRENCSVRQLTSTGLVTTIAGAPPPAAICTGFTDGTGSAARFGYLSAITYDTAADKLYVADNCAIRQVSATGVVTTIAGSVPPNPSCGFTDGTGSNAKMGVAPSMTYDSADGNMYFIDHCGVRRVTPSGVVTTISGGAVTSRGCGYVDGIKGTAKFSAYTDGIAFDADNGMLYVTDSQYHAVRQVDPTTGAVVTIAGSPPPGAQLYIQPMTDGIGSNAYICYAVNCYGLVYVHSTGSLYTGDITGVRQIQL